MSVKQLQCISHSLKWTSLPIDRLSQRYFLTEPLEWVSTLQLSELVWCVLVQELIDTHVAASDSDLNLVLLDPHVDFLRAKFIHTLTVSHKHYLQFISVRVIVDKFGHFKVNGVVLDRHVDCYTRFEVNDVAL